MGKTPKERGVGGSDAAEHVIVRPHVVVPHEQLASVGFVVNLSDYAVKAENYRLLVPRANYSDFEKLLKEGGFIISERFVILEIGLRV